MNKRWGVSVLGILWLFVAFLLAPSPAAAHKIRVSDSSTEKLVVENGGRFLADYGSYRLYAVDNLSPDVLRQDQAELRDDYDRIRLNAAIIDTTTPKAMALHKAVAAFPGKRMHLIQFVGPVQPTWHEALKKTGAQILGYLPQNAYLVYGDAQALAKLQGLAGAAVPVQWDGDYLDDYKLHPQVRLVDEKGNPRQLQTDTFAIQLVNDPDANPATLALIDRLKLEPVRRQYNLLQYVNVFVRLRAQDLGAVASQPDVISIQPYHEPRKLDERQDQIVAGNLNGNSPTGPGEYLAWLAAKGFTQAQFTASGFAVDISDSGIDGGTTAPGHFGLYVLGATTNASRVIYNRLEGTPNNPGSTIQGCDGHGNINAHIVCGYDSQPAGFPHTDSGGFYYGLGVCPFVKVGSSVMFDPALSTNPDFGNLLANAYHDGARISNDSWGEDNGGGYNPDSQLFDALVRDAQPAGSTHSTAGNQEMVIVFSAGNSGPNHHTVTAPGTAKNVMTVGAAENVRSMNTLNGGNTSSGNDGCDVSDLEAKSANDMHSASSRGPCFDGRSKPDLVAPGTHVTGGAPQSFPPPSPNGTGSALSCFLTINANDIGVCGLSGSGSVAADNFFPVGQQFFTESSGTSHAAPCVTGASALLRQYFINQTFSPPSPAMNKAYLMNSTRYMTGTGAHDDLWSVSQGMGELDLETAFDGAPRILRDQAATDKFTASGQTRSFSGTISDGSKPFRVTVAWTDAPGSTTGSALDNDLDLAVTVGGATYKGNVFSGAFSVTGGSADHLNNVESVFLPAGTIGNFTVTISAANINSDGVPGDADPLDQDFALVVYNGAAVPTNSLIDFAAAAGVYQGLIQSHSGSPQTSGLITITVGNTGLVSAKLTFGGMAYSVNGTFDDTGKLSVAIPGGGASPLTLVLQLELTNGTGRVTGTLSDATLTSDVMADPLAYNSKTNPATAFQGYYTVLLPPNPDDTGAGFPQGNGFGTLKVDSGGNIKFSGTLGDGTPISQKAVVSKDGTWPVFIPLYGKQGVMAGWVTFTNIVGVSDLNGALTWFKPPVSNSRFYPNGFTTVTSLFGSKYTTPSSGTPVLNVANSNCNVLVTVGNGNLGSFSSNSVTLTAAKAASPCAANGFKFFVTASTGLFSGSFVNPSAHKSILFRGAILQKQNIGAGFFLGTDQTGFATVEPSP